MASGIWRKVVIVMLIEMDNNSAFHGEGTA